MLVEMLLDLGAVGGRESPSVASDLRSFGKKAARPLVAATQRGHVGVMEALLGRGPPHFFLEVLGQVAYKVYAPVLI